MVGPTVFLLAAFLCGAQQAGTVSGVVVDSSTRLPIQGVMVRAAGRVTRTDAQGQYTLNLAPSAGIGISLSRSGYFAVRSPAARVDLSAGQAISLDFDLKPLLQISGTVEDYDSGEPITGAHVFALRSVFALGKLWQVPAGLITADTRKGQFQIHNLEPGSYILEIEPEDPPVVAAGNAKLAASRKFHGSRFYPDVARIDQATPIALNLEGDTPVRIRLRTQVLRSVEGEVSAPARIQLLRDAGPSHGPVASGTLSASGPFRIDNVSAGDYRLQALGSDGTFAEVRVSIGDHDATDVRLNPQPVPAIGGTVQMDDADVPLPQGLRVLSGEKQVRVVDGKFSITPEPGGPGLRLAGLPSGYALASVKDFPQMTFTVTQKVGVLRGNIGDRLAVLLPAMSVLTGDFQIALASGSYQYVVLDGEERLLAGVHDFLNAKVAADPRTAEVKAGET
ncbi:MAG: carboxypeptidase regulatory-like domain-containing protein, partial [Acidobacteriota bacterium]|nr:carboxypeptidase regulatory-like domain-containing protein [Acidobacteriota bacterium]